MGRLTAGLVNLLERDRPTGSGGGLHLHRDAHQGEPDLSLPIGPLGHHHVYVAAPSQAAALRAWGSDRDLFARGDGARGE